MRSRSKSTAILAACVAAALAMAPQSAQAKKKAHTGKAMTMNGQIAKIDLPPGDDVLPDRPNAEAADRNCLSCHSIETVLNQPAFTRDTWAAEINKMRADFNAQIPSEDDQAILDYLTSVNGVRRDKWR
jgi:predicted transglutaminase-like cysteine proteinase